MHHPNFKMKPEKFLVLLIIFLTSCGLTPKEIAYNYQEIQPLWAATFKVNRDLIGFSPIEKDAEISLEGKSFFDKPYDKMLHIYGSTSRTIAFKEVAKGSYKWIGEQEIYEGPLKYETPDGIFKEEIVLTYHKEPLSGHELDKLVINYHGLRESLSTNKELTLEEVRPFLVEWLKNKNK